MYLRVDVPTVAAALGALMVAVDGKIEEQEKRVAKALGTRLLGGFAPFVFETLLEGVEEIPAAAELATTVREYLDDKGKRAIMDYLVAIAQADQVVDESERRQLQEIAEALGTEVPPLS